MDWVGKLSGMARRSQPSHGCSTSVYEYPLPTTGPNLVLPQQKKPIENPSLHVRSPLPLLPIRYLSRYVESDANDFTGNHGNELYRRSAGVPQETPHRHGCHNPKYDWKKYSSHSCFVRTLSPSLPSPVLSLASHIVFLSPFLLVSSH